MPDLNSPKLVGDVSGTIHATSVDKLKGSAISATAPSSGQVLTWNGTAWAPATASTGGGGGANGLTYYLNNNTSADAPTTGIPGTPKQLGRTGETTQTSVTTGTLTSNTWTLVAGFVSETTPQDPATTLIPAGLWDFNVWALGVADQNHSNSIRVRAYIYDGTTLTALGTSAVQSIGATSQQYSVSMLVEQTSILATDRIYVAIEALATANGHTVTAQFGDNTPSHAHTSLGLIGGTGLWKNLAGTLQSPASLLVDADVDPAAAIAQSKIADLTTDLDAKVSSVSGGTTGLTTSVLSGAVTIDGTLAISNGGTGSTNSEAAILALGIPYQVRVVAGRLNLGTGTVSGQTYTVTATGVLTSIDGSAISAGDLVAVVQGAGGSTNFGFWIVTNAGAVGVQAVLTRPSWYQNGTTWNYGSAMFVCARSTSQQGSVFAFVATTGSINNWTIGTSGLAVNSVYTRSGGNASLGANTYTSTQTFVAGSALVAPARFQSSVLLTTATAHAMEWDGTFLYTTTSGAVRTQQAAFVPVPATASSAGVAGQIAYDATNIYVCVAANTWRRAQLQSF